ncbi:MAG: RagB/SusD family nutrient uptake outer membrane protein [Duncaniella sp.]|nr:RagB/SusD family nutrient uptake outer membrane protein [Duncaniella sp.]
MKFLKHIAFAAVASLALSGCSDALEADNKSNGGQNAEDYFSSNPELIIPTAYQMLTKFAFQVDMHDAQSDMYMCPRSGSDTEFARFAITSETSALNDYYKNAYKLIWYANGLINYGGEGSECAQHGIFLRNYGYFLLTQQFGAVPYITHFIQDASIDYPRTPLEEIYPAMIAELTDLYNTTTFTQNKHDGQFNKQAVAALLGEVCLAAGWDLGTSPTDLPSGKYSVNDTKYFREAAKWAEAAINGTALSMTYAQKWDPRNEGNAEEIFSVNYCREVAIGDVETGGHFMHNNYTCYFDNCLKTGMKPIKSGGLYLPSEKAVMLFQKGDSRFEDLFMTTIYNAKSDGTTAVWGKDGGYYAPYFPDAKLDELRIAVKVFPYYTTDAEIDAWFAAHKEQIKAPDKIEGTDLYDYGIVNPLAMRLSDNADLWDFKKDGTVSRRAAMKYIDYSKTAGINSLSCKKWDDPDTPQRATDGNYRDIVLFHVSKCYLNAAEAYLLSGDETKALQKINDVRKRAGLNALASFGSYDPAYTVPASFVTSALDVLLDEYARECYAEQDRWRELRRSHQLIRYNLAFNWAITSLDEMKGADGVFRTIRPIPQNVISNNNSITDADQNPGYRSVLSVE